MKHARRRGRALQAERAAWFRIRPLCVRCEKKRLIARAVELDHIVPLFKGGKDTASNKQGLCSPCHKEKTIEDMGQQRPQRIGEDGYVID